jgi:hypothetical protein
VDQDPASYVYADPVPAFYLDEHRNPDQAAHFDASPDPDAASRNDAAPDLQHCQKVHLWKRSLLEIWVSSSYLKGLSHEIDFKNFDKNLQNLTYLRDAVGF